MKITAITLDHLRDNVRTEVRSITTWIDGQCRHIPSERTLNALLKEAKKSGKLSIYTRGKFEGHIDAFEATTLFTNGQEIVYCLIVNDRIVYDRGRSLAAASFQSKILTA